MKNFDSRAYGINDFKGWYDREELKLSPKFQRRNVWTQIAKSFLIDTIVSGKPMPKVFIRETLNGTTKQSIREVVDGQQRLTAILEFLDDEFVISKNHNKELGGLSYSELPEDVQVAFLRYEITVDQLPNLPDEEVLDIFSRLNTYTVVLNPQEKLNAIYVGVFKNISYRLGFEFVNFFLTNRIFTDKTISRMDEARLTSELLFAMADGIQGLKDLPKAYKKYDEDFPNKEKLIQNYRHTMDLVGIIFQKIKAEKTNFSKPPMFYSLFLALYDLTFNLPKFKYPKIKITEKMVPQIALALDRIDGLFSKKEELNGDELAFINAASGASTDPKQRRIRHAFILNAIYKSIEDDKKS